MIDTTSLSEQIEVALKKEILDGKFALGERIPIEKLANNWGISVTPVRDAVRSLESKGYVKVVPRRGVYVAELDRKTFKEIFDIRIALECLAVELSTPLIPASELERIAALYAEAEKRLNATGDQTLLIENDHLIHALVVEYCQNDRLIEIMANLSGLIEWARMTIVKRQPDSYVITLPEHRAIVDALLARDADAAYIAMRRHLKNAVQRALDNWGGK